jgi:hypothetical protein
MRASESEKNPVPFQQKGVLTYNAEGRDLPNDASYSRIIHWPANQRKCATSASGVTIGRGFDLGNRTEASAFSYLTRAGIDVDTASKIAKAAGMKRCDAMNFVKKTKILFLKSH